MRQTTRLWLVHPVALAGCFFLSFFFSPATAHGQDADTTPPALVDFDVNPPAIDVSAGPQDITTTLVLTDDLSGVAGASISFRSPSGGQVQFVGAFQFVGDRLNGTFHGTLAFPQFSENGTWTVTSIFVQDLAGNSITIDTATLNARGLPTTLIVSSNPTDTTAPLVTGIAISPANVDVSANPQTITVSLELADTLSGVMFVAPPDGSIVGFFPVQVRSPSGSQRRFIANAQMTQTSGTPQAGTWQGTFVMPQFSEAGTWTIEFLQLRDLAANQRFLNTTSLQALGLPVTFNVSSNPADTTPPDLQNLSFAPTVINTSTSNQSVQVTLDIADDLAGVQFSPTTSNLSFFEGGVQFRSPSGQQIRSAAFFSSFQLVSGTPQNGTWRTNVFFPRFSEDGTWRINVIQLKDATRNLVSFDTAALEARGLPTSLVVLRPSLVGDGTISDPAAGGTISDDTFGSRAQVTFPPGVVSQATSVAIDVFQDPIDVPMPTGFQAAGTHFVNIELTPQPAFPLPSPGLTIRLPLPDPRPAGSPLALFRIDPATGSLVPAIGAAGPIVGTVDAGGLSATFAGILSLSTVVGLVADTSPVSIDVMPGTTPNSLECTRDSGVVPVALLSGGAFEASSVVLATVRFGRSGSEASEVHRDRSGQPQPHLGDVNGDGRPDLVFHFRPDTLGFSCTDVPGESFADLPAQLTGETRDGTAISGMDVIRLTK